MIFSFMAELFVNRRAIAWQWANAARIMVNQLIHLAFRLAFSEAFVKKSFRFSD